MDTYEKKYNEALKRAKAAIDIAADKDLVKGVASTIFPELRESEDERIIKLIANYIHAGVFTEDEHPMALKAIDWLEKQKEQKPPVDVDPCDASWDAYYQRGLNKGYELGLEAGRKEQKPNSTEDMPYVADEHFFEREPADSFKYRLAEYMTKNCKKGEGPYGYSYNISSESILQMAKEELIKRGELKEQKPVEWSEEDEKMLKNVLFVLESYVSRSESASSPSLITTYPTYYKEIDWLKSLRPQWKPTEEQMEALAYAIQYDLEEYASRAGFDYVDNIVQEHPGHRFNDHDVEYAYRDGIIAGAKWQAEQLLKSSPLPEDTVLFNKGVAEGKRLMMEEAVEGEAEELYNDGEIHCTVGVGTYFKPGDKVYVLKAEEDEK